MQKNDVYHHTNIFQNQYVERIDSDMNILWIHLYDAGVHKFKLVTDHDSGCLRIATEWKEGVILFSVWEYFIL